MDATGKLEPMGPSVTVRFTRKVAAPPQAVWDALTEPKLLEAWLAQAEFEASEGGKVHLVWPGQGEMHGSVLTYVPTSELEYSWSEATSSMLRFELEPDGSGSTLHLIHAGTSPDDAVGFGAGWQSHLEALDTVLAGGTSTSTDRDARYEELKPAYEAMLKRR
jgi:uncharacterized protein YndB with AHSA1/START domain